MIGSNGARLSPERVRNDAEVRRARRVGIEGMVVIAGPGRHYDRAVRAGGLEKRLDHPLRPALDWSDRAERGMDDEHATRLDPEVEKLGRESGGCDGRGHTERYPVGDYVRWRMSAKP